MRAEGDRVDLLHLSHEHVDGAAVVIRVSGELDAATTPGLVQLVGDLVSLGHNRLVLDLGDLTFIDSTGIGAFVGARNRAREAYGSLVLRAVPDRVAAVLAVVGLDGVFEVEALHRIDLVDLATR